VKNHLGNLWAEQVSVARAVTPDVVNDSSQESSRKPEPQLRTCDLTLGQLLRQDFDDDTRRAIQNILEDKQASLSAHFAEIQTAVMKAHVEIFHGLLHPEPPVKVILTDFLPSLFTIRDERLLHDPSILVPKANVEFIEMIADACGTNPTSGRAKVSGETKLVRSDIKGIFSQDCLQYLSSRLMEDEDSFAAGSSSEPPHKKRATEKDPKVVSQDESTRGQHPLWDRIVNLLQGRQSSDAAFLSNACCPDGLSLTRNELLRTLGTNIGNLWSSTLYFKLKSAVVRYLLRLHLRPIGEQKHRDVRALKAKEKKDKAATKDVKPATIRKALGHKRARLLGQLDQAIKTCNLNWSGPTLLMGNPVMRDGTRSRVQRVHTILGLIDANERILLSISDDQGSGTITNTLVTASIEVEDDEEDEAATNDDGFLEAVEEDLTKRKGDEGTKVNVPVKEPTSKHLRGLEAVTRDLIDDASFGAEVTVEDVRQRLHEPDNFPATEIIVAGTVISPESCVQYRLVESCSQFLLVLLESARFCAQKALATLTCWTYWDYAQDMASYFQTGKFTFIDRDTVRVLGEITRPDPLRNVWTKKRKEHRPRPRSSEDNPYLLQLQESGMSDDQAAAVASYVADELEVMSSTLARLNRKLAVEEATQRVQDKELRVLANEQKGSENIDKMELLFKQKQVVRELRRSILPLRSDIKFYGQQRYTLRKFLEGSAAAGAKHGAKGTEDASQTKMTEPTLYRP
ncbi:hypothetical protein BGZ83_003077, partial [Gryganskiella cystojenkinii]